MIAIVGARGYLDQPHDLTLYEYDGSVDRARPELVVFPQTAAEVAAIVALSAEQGIPIVARGAGTGLSGGSIPRQGGVVIGMSRMNRILSMDPDNERAVVQPGVVNLELSLAGPRHTGTFSRPTLPVNGLARWGETFRKMPAGPTPWLTA